MQNDEEGSLRSQASGEVAEWEPMYGFCATNVHSNESLARALEAVRRRVCAYGGNGRCDCKYGRDASKQQRSSSEQTGCPELTEIIHRLLYRPQSFMADPASGSESVPATPEHLGVAIQRAREIGRRIANEEPTAGAGRVTNRYLIALVDAGLIASPSGVDLPEVAATNPAAVVAAVWGAADHLTGVHSPEASSEASPLIHLVTLSSDTGVMGEWQAFCHGCEERAKGDMPRVAFWRDQHEADTLQVQASSKLEQNLDEGRPAASEPPAAGEADTGPRRWRKGDEEPLCAYLNEDACYLVADRRGRLWLRRTEKTGDPWDRLSTRFGTVGVADWRYLIAAYGPVTEVISSTEDEAPTTALRQEGGDSHEW